MLIAASKKRLSKVRPGLLPRPQLQEHLESRNHHLHPIRCTGQLLTLWQHWTSPQGMVVDVFLLTSRSINVFWLWMLKRNLRWADGTCYMVEGDTLAELQRK